MKCRLQADTTANACFWINVQFFTVAVEIERYVIGKLDAIGIMGT